MFIFFGLMALSAEAAAINNPNLKPSFADLTWYSNRQAVKAQMKSKGYTFVREVPGSGVVDVEYTGKISGIPANILHLFNNSNQLVKTVIIFENNYNSSIYKNWNALSDSLNSKYGKGQSNLDVLENYRTSNSLLEMELDRGKKMSYFWLFPTHNYFIGLSPKQAYTNDDTYYLTLSYESPAWGKELDRRNQDGDL